MKKLFGVIAALGLFCCTYPSFGANRAALPVTYQQQKIKHPTEAMTKDQHTAILNDMRGKRNDAEKIVALKEGVKDKGITIDQLIVLLNQFLTDDSKLECAQYAFPFTTDYKTFPRISDLFSKEDYKMRLEEFYSKNKK